MGGFRKVKEACFIEEFGVAGLRAFLIFAAGAKLDGSLRLSGHYKLYQESISA